MQIVLKGKDDKIEEWTVEEKKAVEVLRVVDRRRSDSEWAKCVDEIHR